MDGSSQAAQVLDIGIKGDHIVFIGNALDTNLSAQKTIDASGYVVTPGFIDPHTHTLQDLSDSIKKYNLNFLHQGVTTVITGSDGGSVVEIGAKLKEWDQNGIGTNAALMVGHRTIRRLVMGMSDRIPSEEELSNLKSLVIKGMQEGALGFSSGLFYAPASFATTEEVIELAKEAARFNGIYDVHIRDESSYTIGLVAAIEETIEIARLAQIPANVSHIKALGVDVWGKSDTVVQIIEKARREGLKITADQYPYRASGTSFAATLLPRWVYANDPDFTPKLEDPELLPEILEGMAENLRRRGGPESLLFTFPKMDSIRGMTLAEVAQRWSLPPLEAAIEVLKGGGSSVASFNMNEADIHHFMKQPWVMTSSDGSNGHPRKYGSFPKKIKEYTLEKQVLSLHEMIQKSTSLTAETFQIEKRGRIQKGFYADIIIFQPEAVEPMATFEEPTEYAKGMEWVIVNGQIAIDQGEATMTLAGKAIQKN